MHFARVRSESPSRERAPLKAKKQKERQIDNIEKRIEDKIEKTIEKRKEKREAKLKDDGFGPYRTEERRDESMAVEDGRTPIGSTVASRGSSSSSSSSGYRYVRRDEVERAEFRRGPR